MRTLYEIIIVILCISRYVLSHGGCNEANTLTNGLHDGPSTSYFLSDKESNNILSQLYQSQNVQKDKHPKENKKLTHKLSGILFVNSHNWTVWINDKPYHSTGQYNDFAISAVSSHYVLITRNDGVTIKLSLDMSC